MKGYQASEIIGKHFSIFYPSEIARNGFPDRELVEAERLGRFEDEGWRVRKDGTTFWANVIITAVVTPKAPSAASPRSHATSPSARRPRKPSPNPMLAWPA
jgi:hypothetical protein